MYWFITLQKLIEAIDVIKDGYIICAYDTMWFPEIINLNPKQP